MTNVLVCIKRVPDAAGEVLLTADEQALDARFVGFTVSAHENCAVELAVSYMEELYPVTVGSVDATPLFDPKNERIKG